MELPAEGGHHVHVNNRYNCNELEKQSSSVKKIGRESTFLLHDIEGATCKQQIPKNVARENFIYSTYI